MKSLSIAIILAFALTGSACQTTSTSESPSAKSKLATKKKKLRKARGTEQQVTEHKDSYSLSKGWDSGLVDFGNDQRKRQALDLH